MYQHTLSQLVDSLYLRHASWDRSEIGVYFFSYLKLLMLIVISSVAVGQKDIELYYVLSPRGGVKA
jgi:hypothetical protein